MATKFLYAPTGTLWTSDLGEVVTDYGALIQWTEEARNAIRAGQLVTSEPLVHAITGASLLPFGLGSHWNEAHHYEKWVEAGVNWIRVTVPWSEVEEVEGVYTWDDIDTAVDTAYALGLKMLVVIAYTPTWATSSPGNEKGAPLETKEAQWVAYARTTYERYRDRVSAWEVWNEADYSIFFLNGAGTWARNNLANDEAGRRAQYLRTVSQALAVMGGGDAVITTTGWANEIYPAVDNGFVAGLNEENTGWFGQFPVFSYHTYGYPAYWRLDVMPKFYRGIEAEYEGVTDHWITEHGITPGGDAATDDEVYRYLIRSYAYGLSQPRVTKIFWFCGGYALDHATFLSGSSVRIAAFYAHQVLTTKWPGEQLATVTPWAHSSALGGMGTMLDGSRTLICWNDGPAELTIDNLGLEVTAAYTRYGDVAATSQTLDSNPVFLVLSD